MLPLTLLHATIYRWLQQEWNAATALYEIAQKRYLAVGTIALVPDGSSRSDLHQTMMRRLGGNWSACIAWCTSSVSPLRCTYSGL